MTLIYLALAWILGIVVANRTDPQGNWMTVVLVGAAIGCLFFWQDKRQRLFFLIVLFFSLGMLRFELARPETNAAHVLHLNDQGGKLTLTGMVLAEPEPRDTALQLLIDSREAGGHPVEGRVLVQVPRYTNIRYGDEVRLFGVLRSAAEFDTFSYRDYLARQGVYSVMYNADAQVLSHDNGNLIQARLLEFKDKTRKFILDALPEPQASLMVGILLGDDSGISDNLQADFTRTGASHIIAISGFNMVILAGVFMAILNRLFPNRKLLAAMIGIAAIVVYTLFVGAGAAVVRAAIMSSVLILGQSLFRKTYIPTSLSLVALLMSLSDPWVLWDVGFQLSFAAVMGMALFVPPLERLFQQGLDRLLGETSRKQIWGFLSDSFIVTLAAQITTTPIILLYFGRLSIVSLLVNFLIIPVQTPLLLTGALGAFIGVFIAPLGELILQVTWVFLAWSIKVVETFADLSWADTELSVSELAVVVFFMVLLIWVIYRATRPRWAMRLIGQAQIPVYLLQGAGLVAVILLVNTISQKTDGQLHVTFLDVEHSNGVLIESPQGAVILVDGGNLPSRLLDQLGDHLPTRTRYIDMLVLTSPIEDNLAALPEVLERYEVGTILTNGQNGYAPLDARITEMNISTTPVSAGYTISTEDGVRIEVLNPPALPSEDELSNVAGLVLRVTYRDAVFLLTGDITAETETALLTHPHLVQASVLQVPAHGSGDASTHDFIETVNPQVAVIQLDEANPNSDPSPTVIERLADAQLFRTDQHGTIEIVSDGQQLWVHTDSH